MTKVKEDYLSARNSFSKDGKIIDRYDRLGLSSYGRSYSHPQLRGLKNAHNKPQPQVPNFNLAIPRIETQ